MILFPLLALVCWRPALALELLLLRMLLPFALGYFGVEALLHLLR